MNLKMSDEDIRLLGMTADLATILPGRAMLKVHLLPLMGLKIAVGFEVSTCLSSVCASLNFLWIDVSYALGLLVVTTAHLFTHVALSASSHHFTW